MDRYRWNPGENAQLVGARQPSAIEAFDQVLRESVEPLQHEVSPFRLCRLKQESIQHPVKRLLAISLNGVGVYHLADIVRREWLLLCGDQIGDFHGFWQAVAGCRIEKASAEPDRRGAAFV